MSRRNAIVMIEVASVLITALALTFTYHTVLASQCATVHGSYTPKHGCHINAAQ